ncbi:histidine kinase N-terminal 7TM domain-containing protein [Halodurantibacterium flavum]|uniref:diguanylate cyclase n=1 Tax=Halodurantibacterium flavum TaxID=1382802 RepID=A0ABW4S677_9RHOB
MIECFLPARFEAPAALAATIMLGMALLARWIANQPFFYGRAGFLLTIVAVVWWLATLTLEVASDTLDCKVFWSSAAWIAIAVIPTSWMFFILDYAFSRRSAYGPGRVLFLVVPPVLATLVTATNPVHLLFYGPGTHLVETAIGPAAYMDHGPLFHLAAIYLYIPLVVSVGVVLYAAFRTVSAFRSHFLLLFFITIGPVIANIAYIVFDVTVMQLDPTPFLFALVLVLLTWLIFSSRMFDITSVARAVLFDKMPNPVLILDENEVVVGANPAALALPGAASGRIGAPVAKWPLIAAALRDARDSDRPGRRGELQIGGRFYQLQQMAMDRPLQTTGQAGQVLLLVEVTEARRHTRRLEDTLQENERRLAENMALRERLEQLVNRDPLTGLYNRRAVPGYFDAFRDGPGGDEGGGCVTVTLAVIDLDHFKAFNDRHGHAEGDRLLRSFGQILARAVDSTCPIFRVGGEEFLVMFPDFAPTVARAALEKAQVKLSAEHPGGGPDGQGAVTFSAGIATWPEDGEEFEAVFAAADGRLYAGKAQGRNRIVPAAGV